MGRKKANGEAPTAATNVAGVNMDSAKGFVERMESLHVDLDKLKSSYMLDCKDIRGSIKEVLQEAADAGISKKALKAVVKARELERKADVLRDELEPDQQDTYDNIRLALGDFSETELGAAALERAQQGASTLDGLTAKH